MQNPTTLPSYEEVADAIGDIADTVETLTGDTPHGAFYLGEGTVTLTVPQMQALLAHVPTPASPSNDVEIYSTPAEAMRRMWQRIDKIRPNAGKKETALLRESLHIDLTQIAIATGTEI